MNKSRTWLPLPATALLTALLVLAGSCGKTPKPGPAPSTPFFRLFTDNNLEVPVILAFDCDGWNKYLPLKVETNMEDWSVESSVAWCKPVPDKSDGKINLALDSYYGESSELFPRNGEVHIRAGTVFDKTIPVSQESNLTYLFTIPDNGEGWVLPASGDPMEIKVMTNMVDWEIVNDCEWIQADRVDRSTLRVRMTPGNFPQGRSGEITLASIVKSTKPGDSLKLHFIEGDAEMSGEDYGYDDVIDWD